MGTIVLLERLGGDPTHTSELYLTFRTLGEVDETGRRFNLSLVLECRIIRTWFHHSYHCREKTDSHEYDSKPG